MTNNHLSDNDAKMIVNRFITLSELAIRYGNPDSTRLFDEDDYKMFLLNRYLVDIKCGNCNHQVVGMER